MKRTICSLLWLAVAPAISYAQTAPASANPVSDALRISLGRASKNMPAAAEAMPPEKFSFKPTAPEMTYGHLVLHIAESNFRFCSAVSGTPAPEQPKFTETDAKDKLVAAVRSSFDFCSTALAKVDDAHLADSVEFLPGRTATRAAAMFILAGSWSDHYSAQSIYLRLNNILPPSAQPAK